jgi:hypothetical protein
MQAQEPHKDFTDPVALLKAVAKTYAAAADTFHMEAITETTSNADLHHEWRKVYHTAIKGPGNLYRIETRSPYGSFIQVSDGVNEWVCLVEGRVYVKRPVPENWPQFPRLQFAGSFELIQAWSMRTWLESTAASYKHPTMLPQETIEVEGRSYPCYVVDTTSKEGGMIPADTNYYADVNLWIDKARLVFRKQVTHARTFMSATHDTHIPYLEDTLAVYPVADFRTQATPEMFRFMPQAGVKEVPELEPDFYVPPPTKSKVSLVGQPAPEVFVRRSGRKEDPNCLLPRQAAAPRLLGHLVRSVPRFHARAQPHIPGHQGQGNPACHARPGSQRPGRSGGLSRAPQLWMDELPR